MSVRKSYNYYGLSRESVETVLKSADLFVDMGTHGAWLAQASEAKLRVVIDGEPGLRQMKMAKALAAGEDLPRYDFYYTSGRNIDTQKSTAPVAGQAWRPIFHPVVVDLFPVQPTDASASFTTVMNWQSYEPVNYNGIRYGHKDLEFIKFLELPRMTENAFEIAVSGKNIPTDQLIQAGWRIRDAHEVTISVNSFVKYIYASRGEFSVCKNGYVATNFGWFSDCSAVYLATGRPVVLQETGFRDHLPCGQGLFAVRTVEEAATAIEAINQDYDRHARAALEIVHEYLDTDKVLRTFLDELGF